VPLAAYPENVLIGLLLILLDLAVIVGLVIAIVWTALRLRPSRITALGVAFWRWTSLIALVAVLGFVVFGNARFVISGYEQGRPTTAQVAGTWQGNDGATIQVRPDGTFVAAGLPADSNDAAGDGKPHPTHGHGTWQPVRGDGSWYVLFTLSGGSRFQLYLGSSVSRADASTATFSWVFARFNAVDIWYFDRH